MHLMRHEHKFDLISYLTHLILGYSCHRLRAAKLKIQIIFISHDFRVFNNSLLTVLFININVLTVKLDILAPDSENQLSFMSGQLFCRCFR